LASLRSTTELLLRMFLMRKMGLKIFVLDKFINFQSRFYNNEIKI